MQAERKACWIWVFGDQNCRRGQLLEGFVRFSICNVFCPLDLYNRFYLTDRGNIKTSFYWYLLSSHADWIYTMAAGPGVLRMHSLCYHFKNDSSNQKFLSDSSNKQDFEMSQCFRLNACYFCKCSLLLISEWEAFSNFYLW